MNRIAISTTKCSFTIAFVACLFTAPAFAQTSDGDLSKRLSKIQAELAEITKSLAPDQATDSDEDAIRSLVKQAFGLQMQLQKMRIDKAESDLERVKQQFVDRKRAEQSIIDARVAELTESIKSAQPVTSSDPDDALASVLSAEGWKAWRAHDWRTALVKFKASVKKDDTDANTLNGLGWTYLHLGEHEKSIEIFKQARKIDPNHGGVLNGLGQNLMALGRMDEAKTILEETVQQINKRVGEAIAVKRGMTAPWFALVRLHISQKEREPAIELAKRYLEHKPDDKMMLQMLDQAKAITADAIPAK